MAHKGPGKAFRKGITLVELMRAYPDDDAAKAWFVEMRWPRGIECPKCGSDRIALDGKHKTQDHRCRACRTWFSVKTGTVMQGSNLGYQTWLLAIYLMSTSLKGVASMKLHRDLGITQKSAWHLAHRIRECWTEDTMPFTGPVEADETYMGGKRANMPKAKRKELTGRGTVGKTVVVGVKDRATNRVSAAVVEGTDAQTLQSFIVEHVDGAAQVFTDEHGGYVGMVFDHERVNHGAGEYVRGEVHTQGIESFWSMLKRAHKGVFHKISPKHMDRYVTEFSGRHNGRCLDTMDAMRGMLARMAGRRLRYPDLIADNGLPSGARS